jgi:uncharacterized RDD family membrane protein YckC
MKCPKCGYLGFERVDRCRNCGYEFALATAAAAPELALQDRKIEPVPPLDDLALRRKTEAPVVAAPSDDLPLFSAAMAAEAPLITKASPPRPPLAVRRGTVDAARGPSEPRTVEATFDGGPRSRMAPSRDLSSPERSSRAGEAGGDDARLALRFLAAAVDGVILLVVDALIVYFTLQVCGISLFELDVLPKVPLLAFLLVQNGGYLVTFTAGGQTLGKMVVGIRVVAASDAEPLDLGRAALRTLLWAVLAIPAGLGLATAAFTSDHRALHDRLAGTRVVRATA